MYVVQGENSQYYVIDKFGIVPLVRPEAIQASIGLPHAHMALAAIHELFE